MPESAGPSPERPTRQGKWSAYNSWIFNGLGRRAEGAYENSGKNSSSLSRRETDSGDLHRSRREPMRRLGKRPVRDWGQRRVADSRADRRPCGADRASLYPATPELVSRLLNATPLVGGGPSTLAGPRGRPSVAPRLRALCRLSADQGVAERSLVGAGPAVGRSPLPCPGHPDRWPPPPRTRGGGSSRGAFDAEGGREPSLDHAAEPSDLSAGILHRGPAGRAARVSRPFRRRCGRATSFLPPLSIREHLLPLGRSLPCREIRRRGAARTRNPLHEIPHRHELDRPARSKAWTPPHLRNRSAHTIHESSLYGPSLKSSIGFAEKNNGYLAL